MPKLWDESEMTDAESNLLNERKADAMSEFLDVSSGQEVSKQIYEYVDVDQLNNSLRSMLIAYNDSMEAYLEADRIIAKKNLEVFTKAYCNLCLNALEKYNERKG